MKKLNLLILIIVNSISLFAQDVGISGSFMPSGIPVGSATTCTVTFTNNDVLQIPAGGVWIQINFPPQYTACRAPAGTLMNYFKTFSYDPVNRVWFGYNTDLIPAKNQGFSEGILVFEVTGNDVIGINDATLLDTDFEVLTDKDPSDNQATAGLIVTKADPVEIKSFSGIVKECGKIELTWTTGTEISNDYMELMRSTDGKNFTSAGKIKGTNDKSGSVYMLTDSNDLADGSRYFYMIVQVDNDGTKHSSQLIEIQHDCIYRDPELIIYPNPASQKISISISNLKARDVSAAILNRKGVTVKKISFNSSLQYEMELKDLPSGVYKIQTLDLDKPLISSFVRVK
ncbi:MAG: hypothetical protein IPH57_06580 [Saprospiraceae bacterium]|nr:hypothetical protein [Saprospiraceae bacterium]